MSEILFIPMVFAAMMMIAMVVRISQSAVALSTPSISNCNSYSFNLR
jgi:hypothetical protein